MPVSANTLFHFTRKSDTLIKIIAGGFRPSYCLEDLGDILRVSQKVHVPMVCFCDIPLSQISKHIDSYGTYGIGLRKKPWGVNRGISPVLYYAPQSHTATLMNQAVRRAAKDNLNENSALYEQLIDFCKYIKKYERTYWNRSTGKLDVQTLYDEREWRYTPPRFHALLNTKKNHNTIQEQKNKLHGAPYLKFSAQDVKYLVVRSEAEIPRFIGKLEGIANFSKASVKLLSSKVISSKQILEDI
jgi:hypothetical protein